MHGGASVRFLTRCDRKLREPFVWHQGIQVSMRMARGRASLLSRYDTGIGPQDTLKQAGSLLSERLAGDLSTEEGLGLSTFQCQAF